MIKKFSVKNFRNIKDSTLELEKVNVLVGKNRAGKTSYMVALQTLLSSVNQFTDDRGSGNKDLIRHGAKEAEISATVESGAKLTVTVPGTPKQPYFAKWLVEACLRPKTLLEPTNLKNALHQLIDLKLTNEELINRLNLWDEEFPEMGSRFYDFLDKEGYLAENKQASIKTFLPIAEQQRRLINAKIDIAVKAQKAQEDTPQESPPEFDEKTLKKAKEHYKKSLEKYSQHREKMAGDSSDFRAKYLEWERNKLEGEKIERAFKQGRELLEKIGEKRENSKEWNDKLESLGKEQIHNQKQVEKIQAQIDEINRSTKCPAGQCAKVELKKLTEEMKALRLEKERILEETHKTMETRNEIVDRNMKREEIEERLKRVEAAKARWKDVPEPQKEALDEEGQKLKNFLDEAEKEVLRLEEVSKEYERFVIRKQEKENHIVHADELQPVAKQWDMICKALGPKGIETQIFDERKGKILGLLNERAKKFFDIELNIEVDPWLFTVDNTNINILCWGEQSMALAVIQSVIAEVAKFNLICVDEHGFDPQFRSSLLKMLFSIKCQSFMLNTITEMEKVLCPECEGRGKRNTDKDPDAPCPKCKGKKLVESGHLVVPRNPGIKGLKIFYVHEGEAEEV